MKIIKEGKVVPKTRKRTCPKCHTVFEYGSKDVKRWNDEYADEVWVYVTCPLCKRQIETTFFDDY
jgi:RNase P subunit RPR2